MRHNFAPLTAALALVFATGFALAEDTRLPPAGPAPFAAVDTDADGFINEKEFTHMHNERIRMRTEEGRMMRNMGNAPAFADLDTDGDGRVTREEYQAHQQERMQLRMEQRGGGMGPGGGRGPGGGMGRQP